MNLAYITDSVHINPVTGGVESIDYRWEGHAHWPVEISDHVLCAHRRLLADLPWKLVLLEYDPSRAISTYIRRDGLYPLVALAAWRVGHLLLTAKSRLILTAAVWGLARWPGLYRLPAWTDIHLFRAGR